LVYITPLLKKVDLDLADPRSYQPISSLSVLSKLLERIITRQLIDYLKSSKLLPRIQSAYRAHHSTGTAVLRILADILAAVDRGDLAMLTLLDLSATFDAVDQKTLLYRLKVSMASATRCTDGLFCISAVDHSLFAVVQHHRFQRLFCSVSRKGQSWDRSSFCCIQPT